MDYMTANETAEKWGISARRVTLLCNEGRVDGAVKKGLMWMIPKKAEKPVDPRKERKEADDGKNKKAVTGYATGETPIHDGGCHG